MKQIVDITCCTLTALDGDADHRCMSLNQRLTFWPRAPEIVGRPLGMTLGEPL